jgi:hypothetical protein
MPPIAGSPGASLSVIITTTIIITTIITIMTLVLLYPLYPLYLVLFEEAYKIETGHQLLNYPKQMFDNLIEEGYQWHLE